MLSLDDETMSIINKPKHSLPPKRRKTRNKMKGFRVLVSLPYKVSQQNIIDNQSNSRILAIGCKVKIRSKKI
jgi:hypothetical protein